jgi:hypothetical protein
LERKSEIENLKYPKGLKNRILVMLNKTGQSEIYFLRESKEMGEKRTAFSTLTKKLQNLLLANQNSQNLIIFTPKNPSIRL